MTFPFASVYMYHCNQVWDLLNMKHQKDLLQKTLLYFTATGFGDKYDF